MLHNMIVEDKKDMVTRYDLNETPGSFTVADQQQGYTFLVDVIQRDVEVRDRPMHKHIWGRFGMFLNRESHICLVIH